VKEAEGWVPRFRMGEWRDGQRVQISAMSRADLTYSIVTMVNINVHWRSVVRLDLRGAHHTHTLTRDSWEVMDKLICLIMVITSQRMLVSNHHVYSLNICQFYLSIRPQQSWKNKQIFK
jgi:hypothetical protein